MFPSFYLQNAELKKLKIDCKKKMVKTFTWHATLLAIIIPSSLFLFLVILIRSDYYGVHHVSLRVPIVLDFVITAPLLYFLFVRKKKIPNYTVFSIFIIGVILASYFLPHSDQELLLYIRKWIVPVLEILILSIIIRKTVSLVKQTKKSRADHGDFYDAIRKASHTIFPGTPGAILASEISMIYYLIRGWKPKILRANEYSYHKKSGSAIIYFTLLFVFVVEAWVVHILMIRWNPVVAWILTILTIYGILQFTALLASLRRRPIIIDRHGKILLIRYGYMMESSIPLGKIDKIEQTSRTPRDTKGFIKTFPLESHNIIIRFREDISFQLMYGRTKKCRAIGLHIDERENFVSLINKFL